EPPPLTAAVVDQDVRAADCDRIVGELREKLANRLLRIDADLRGIRADERAREDATGQPRDLVALERFERAHRDLGRVGDLAQRHAALLARLAHAGPEVTVSAGDCGHWTGPC